MPGVVIVKITCRENIGDVQFIQSLHEGQERALLKEYIEYCPIDLSSFQLLKSERNAQCWTNNRAVQGLEAFSSQNGKKQFLLHHQNSLLGEFNALGVSSTHSTSPLSTIRRRNLLPRPMFRLGYQAKRQEIVYADARTAPRCKASRWIIRAVQVRQRTHDRRSGTNQVSSH